MKTSLFIRTYRNDLPWLHELFRSLDKFASGFHETVVQCDTADLRGVEKVVAGRARITHRAPYSDVGYRSQQGAKIAADCYTTGDYITFLDSDCILTGPTTPETFFSDGKPILLYTPWSAVGDAICWREPTEKILGLTAPYEFMRRHGLTYPREMFADLRRHIEQTHRVNDAINFAMSFHLSEYNLFGTFCWHKRNSEFAWFNTTDGDYPPSPVRQFLSYGSITPEVRAEIERALA
jgi:hypothetical protein